MWWIDVERVWYKNWVPLLIISKGLKGDDDFSGLIQFLHCDRCGGLNGGHRCTGYVLYIACAQVSPRHSQTTAGDCRDVNGLSLSFSFFSCIRCCCCCPSACPAAAPAAAATVPAAPAILGFVRTKCCTDPPLLEKRPFSAIDQACSIC